MNMPEHCRPAAFQMFAEQIPVLDTTEGLLNAAVAVSMHGLDDIDPAGIEHQLQDMADQILSRVHGTQPQALLAHLHHFLFESG